jgi:hypothetical protein
MVSSSSDHRVKELATQLANEIKRKCLDKSAALDERVDDLKESLFVSTKILKNALAADAVRIGHLENDREDRSAALALASADASPNTGTKPPPEWAEDIVKRPPPQLPIKLMRTKLVSKLSRRGLKKWKEPRSSAGIHPA